jgi:peptide/nickel transport system permease protein
VQGYIVRRLLATIPVVVVVMLFTFTLLRIAPGDPASLIAGVEATEGQIEAIRESLGLNRPIHVQLGIFFRDTLKGDFGESITSGKPVLGLVIGRLIPTISLAALSEGLAVILAVPLGILAAWRANSLIDRSIMALSTLGFSIPLFFLGFLFIIAFGVKLQWFPVAGYVAPSEDFGAFIHRLIMPAVATGIVVMALIARMTRSSMLEILREDYIRTARAKGLAERMVLVRHALKNAALPIITVIGLGVAGLMSGLVVTESVFAIPGVGRLVVDAMVRRDYPVIQAAIVLISTTYVFVNLLVDLSYAYFDPRIRY